MTKKPTSIFIGIILLIIGFSSIDFIQPYYNIDELTNSLFANFIIDGRLNLFDFVGNTYIATHYMYVLFQYTFGQNDLTSLYIFKIFWTIITAKVLIHTGKEITGRYETGYWASLFYVLCSYSFLCKDFRAILSEPFSLLPLSLAAYTFFKHLNTKSKSMIFFCGFWIAIAGLFKAPASIMIIPVCSSILFRETNHRIRDILLASLGLSFGLMIPVFLTFDLHLGLDRLFRHVNSVNKFYIGAYENLPLLFWGLKYLLRTGLVAISSFVVWILAFKTLQSGLLSKNEEKLPVAEKSAILFLFFWALSNWFIVSIGKRVFFHYFIFLIPPIVLLASLSMTHLQDKWRALKSEKNKRMYAAGFFFFLFLPTLIFSAEAALGISPRRPNFPNLIQFIQETTKPKDRS